MAKGVGLDAGAFEVKVVELDGTYRKPRLAKVSIDRVQAVATGLEGHEDEEAQAAVAALKDAEVARDDVCLGFPCREAVLRTMQMPFVGTDAIRKVLKFEAESEIHSHNVDDMVADFHTLHEGEHETRVLVAAVPKKTLGNLLKALNGLGVDPERVDLDTMALFRTAKWAGCFGEDAIGSGEDEGDEDGSDLPAATGAPLTTGGRRVRLVLDLGARSTRVLAVDGGELIDMRALRVGFESIVDEIAAKCRISSDEARHAIEEALRRGTDVAIAPDQEVEPELEHDEDSLVVIDHSDEEEEERASEDEADHQVARADVVLLADVEAARDALLARMRRELMRFLTALPQIAGIERAFVTGGGASLQGVRELLAETFDCQIEDLDVLGRLNHNLPEDEARSIGPRIAVAVGLALSGIGGSGGFDFRREDLAYRRRFDRIKFPFAIACMLAVFLPFIYGVRQHKQLTLLSQTYGELYRVSGGEGGADEGGRRSRRGSQAVRAEFWGYVGQLMNKTKGGGSNQLVRLIGAQKFEQLTKKLVDADTFDRLKIIRSYLQSELRKQQEATGVYDDLQLSSGTYVMAYFADVIQSVEKRAAPFLITHITLKLHEDERNRHLTFKAAIRGEDYRTRFAVLQDAFRASFDKPESPFEDFGTAKGEDVFDRGGVPGASFEVRLIIKKDFQQRADR